MVKIRSIFIQEGLGGEWDTRLGIGNPARIHLLKRPSFALIFMLEIVRQI